MGAEEIIAEIDAARAERRARGNPSEADADRP